MILPKDNTNPNSTIGFFCWSPYHYYVYKSTYENLPNSEFIIGEPRYYDKGSIPKNLNELAGFLNEKKVFWRLYNASAPKDLRMDFFRKYKAIISVWSSQALKDGLLDDKIKVRIQYGNAKDLWSFGPWNADFDLILAHGKYAEKYFKFYTLTKIVGNPLLDGWFQKKYDKTQYNELRSKLDPGKKTVLFLPTHNRQSGLGTLDLFDGKSAAGLGDYNFIIKPHYHAQNDDSGSVRRISQLTSIVFDERYEPVVFIEAADLVISDNSGAIFDAILADKPIIFLKTPESALSLDNFRIDKTDGSVYGALMRPDGLVQKIKKGKFAVGPVMNSFSELGSAIEELNKHKTFFGKNRNRIKEMVFGYQDGLAGKRASVEISNLIKNYSGLQKHYPLFYFIRKRDNLIRRQRDLED